MDFLTIENPHTSAEHECSGYYRPLHMQYVKAIVIPNQSARARVTAFWNKFIANYGFPEKLLTWINNVTLNLN